MTENKAPVKVEINQVTPSQQIIKSSAKEVEIIDDLGRIIKLKKPSPLANLDFRRALGITLGNNTENLMYLAETMPLAYVVAIDGEMVATPATNAEIRALYQRLDEEGNKAVQKAVVDNFFNQQQDVKAELKNS